MPIPGGCLLVDVDLELEDLLGGSWLVISRVISRVTVVITYIRGLITPLITTHELEDLDAHRLGLPS